MANTIMEQSLVGILREATWGTGPSGNAMTIEVDAGDWLQDIVEEFRDEMVRNVLARDFNSVATVARGEGTLSGAMTSIMPGYFWAGIFGGTEITGNIQSTTPTDTNMDYHEFVIGSGVESFTIQTSDGIMTGVAAEIYLGMMVSSFTLRFNSGEGAIEWESEFIGQGRVFSTVASKTVADNTELVAANGPPKPMVGSMAMVDINGNSQARVLDAEIVFSRDIELSYGANNTQRPNIRRISTPRITFRATCELQLASDIQKYSNWASGTNAQSGEVTASGAVASSFQDNLDTWHFRFATDPDITLASTPVPTTVVSGNADGTIGDEYVGSTDTNDCVIDIYLDRVTYASSPIAIDRGEQTATFEFNGIALYDQVKGRLGVFRIMNRKETTYVSNDV